MVSDARQVPDSSASDQNNAVLLQIMSNTGNIRGHFHTVRKTNSCNLSQSGIRFFRRDRSHDGAYASFLRAADVSASFGQAVETLLQRGRSGFFLDRLSAFPNQLVKCRHFSFTSVQIHCITRKHDLNESFVQIA